MRSSAHRAFDAAVDKLYRADAFPSDRQRVEHLFTRYEKLVTPLTAISKRETLQIGVVLNGNWPLLPQLRAGRTGQPFTSFTL